MSDADLLDDLIARLVLLRQNAGPDAFRKAVVAARTSVGRCVLAEAEARAGVERRPAGTVIRFPIGGLAKVDRSES